MMCEYKLGCPKRGMAVEEGRTHELDCDDSSLCSYPRPSKNREVSQDGR